MLEDQILIREAISKDAHNLYQLHIESIQHFCSPCYSEAVIQAWINSKSPSAYLVGNEKIVIYVAEANKIIYGFGILNLESKSIDSLYLQPGCSGRGLGKALLETMEKYAKKSRINWLYLSSTLNAQDFYKHMHYKVIEKSACRLRSGVEIDCIKMKKSLM